ncbi:hypothetical protein [Micromonospora sp. NBC_01813]|uniref:hypothetical protein n=1 Tax=Micromonospora sp. NBC_01813 TaxID=2975988 RepID=UPI002DD9F00C|nr:hypothetical protein [Micromonospora sp. NBC_01813]WSA06195.1 hypothetical protein OG958_17835 [Micromonospora sp. NBC_01813]
MCPLSGLGDPARDATRSGVGLRRVVGAGRGQSDGKVGGYPVTRIFADERAAALLVRQHLAEAAGCQLA